MITYYHYTTYRQCLVTILITNLPSLHSLSFHEMISILFPPSLQAALERKFNRMRNQNALCNRVFSKGYYESRGSARVYYGSNTEVLLVKRHIACHNRVDLCENHGFYYRLSFPEE